MATKKTFESALSELEQIVLQLERADIPLEEAMKQFQHGMELSQFCKQTLEQAEKTVTKLISDSTETELEV